MLGRTTLVVALLTIPFALPAASPAPLTLPVALDGLEDVAVLRADDPRAGPLAARDPLPALGLFAGRLAASGSLVHLVWTPELALALVQTGEGLTWASLEDGALVPLPAAAEQAPWSHGVDEERYPPQAPQALADGSSVDGKLQLLLDADAEFVARFGTLWDDHQLRVLHLVRAIYLVHLGVDIEVVEQHAWPAGPPLTSTTLCQSGDLLGQFRNAWESTRPTLAEPREAAHLFTGKQIQGSVIGCAWVGALETPWAYGVSEVSVGGLSGQTQGLRRDVLLVAHEIGHNFRGVHGRAIPTPGGGLDPLSCLGPVTIMYPCLAYNVPSFSHVPAGQAALGPTGVVQDGGNVPWMRDYASGRI